MKSKKEHPLSPDEIDEWVDCFDETELIRHGWSKSQLREAFNIHDYTYWRPENEIVSCIFYHFPDSGTLEVLFLATAPPRRRRAGMERLLTSLVDQHTNRQIWLECRQDNAIAIELYRKLGFRAGHRRLGYYRDGTAAILFDF